MLANQELPVYQPGTVMFETAVKSDSDISVVHGGSQQNGAILGNGCAVFLCKFLVKLVQRYEKQCGESGINVQANLN